MMPIITSCHEHQYHRLQYFTNVYDIQKNCSGWGKELNNQRTLNTKIALYIILHALEVRVHNLQIIQAKALQDKCTSNEEREHIRDPGCILKCIEINLTCIKNQHCDADYLLLSNVVFVLSQDLETTHQKNEPSKPRRESTHVLYLKSRNILLLCNVMQIKKVDNEKLLY